MQCERHNQEKCGLNCRDEYDVEKLVYSVVVVASIVVNEVKKVENTFLFLHLLILYFNYYDIKFLISVIACWAKSSLKYRML